MPLYLMLGKMNQETRTAVYDDPKTISRAANSIGSNSARFLVSYASLGRFDYVLIAEADNDAEAAQLSLKMSNETTMALETVPILSSEQLYEAGRGYPVTGQPDNRMQATTNDGPTRQTSDQEQQMIPTASRPSQLE